MNGFFVNDSKHDVNASIVGSLAKVISASIASGESLTGEIDLEQFTYLAIVMPSEWTPANLTFQVSDASGGTYQNVYDDTGVEATVIVSASRTVSIDMNAMKLQPFRYLKIRSGTSVVAVNQTADRTIKILTKV